MTTQVPNALLNPQPAKVLLQTINVAGLATVDFLSGNFSSAYDHYEIEFSFNPVNDGVQVRMLMSANNGASWHSTYRTSGTNTVSDISIATGGCSNGTNSRRTGKVDFFRNGAAAVALMQWQSCGITTAAGGSFENVSGGGMTLTAADINALRFFPSTGNFLSGYMSIYGVRK